jgi:ABC-type nitrate/sulfonate/bicarbonate transport system permease component
VRRTLALRQLAAVVVILTIWQLVSISGLVAQNLLPTFTSVVGELAAEVTSPTLWQAVWDTVVGAVQGLVAAALVAIPLGLLAGLSPFLERSTRVLSDFGRSFPALAMMPVFLLLFGATTTTKSVIVFIACSFPLFVQTLYGARRIEPSIVETSRSFRIPMPLYFRRVALPSAIPFIMTGLRLAAITAVLVSIGSEVIGGIPGIGRELSVAQQDGAAALAYAYILAAGLLGYAVTRSAEALEGHFLRWRPEAD